MHALIACVGSAGDVHPFVAIGLALKQRGHTVQLMASAYFHERIQAAGLGFLPIGSVEEFERVLREPDLWDGRKGFGAICRLLEPLLEPAYDALVANVVPGETVLVGSTLAFPVRLAQEKLGLPAATVHLSPATLYSAAAPPVWAGLGWLPRLPRWGAKAVMSALEWAAIDPVVRPGLNPLRAKLGLPPVRHVMSRWLHSPQRVICAWPEWFAPLPADAPPNTVCTGFARWAGVADRPLEVALEAFLQAGPPPIAFTPGSAMAQGRDFFDRALAACATLQRRAVLVTPFRDQLPAVLPPFAFHAAYAPYDRLAPRVAAFVHHGGIGTCAQALAAGVPQLITPFAHDQFDNAARLLRLGVAASVSPSADASRWAGALATLLGSGEHGQRARALAERLREEPPPAGHIAGLIEALASR